MIIPFTPIFLVGVCGFVYLIVTLQLSSGFPPFYKKVASEEELIDVLPYIFAIFALVITSIFFPYLFILVGLVSAWCGIRVRRRVQQQTDGPLPWLLTPLTIGVLNRWPMLLFDVFAIGNAAFMGFIMLI